MSEIEKGEKPPRIAPLADLSEELRELAMPPKGYGTPGELTVAYRILLNHPAVVRDLRPIGEFFLRETLLPMRDRELLILRASWLCRSPYEWGEHVAIGKANGVIGLGARVRPNVRHDDVDIVISGCGTSGNGDGDYNLR